MCRNCWGENSPHRTFSDDEIIAALLTPGPEGYRPVRQLYARVRPRLLNWVVWGPEPEMDSWDLVQDGMERLLVQLRAGKFQGECALDTYLYQICRFRWKEMCRSKYRGMERLEEGHCKDELEEDSVLLPLLALERSQTMGQLLDSLPGKCGQILRQYYFKGYSLESIAIRLGYANENVTKVRKCKCMRKVLDFLRQHPDFLDSLYS